MSYIRMLLAGTAVLSLAQAASAQGLPGASSQPPQPPADAAPVPATSVVAPVAAAPTEGGIGEIVVTAQKRSQLLNDVPITVSVASGQQLAERGIVNTADLGKIVSGFVFIPSPQGQPVYVLRGVGLYDSGLGSAPTVSVYTDQAPLPFSLMTAGAALDLERVEVLKGPQGTLFGTNNTGGAINYIAAKPTNHFEAGGSASYERFDKATINGYISGPVSDTLSARLAMQGITGGAWQQSLTRSGDTLGNQRFFTGRLLLDYHPNDKLKVTLNVNGFRDRGDTQASQLLAINPSIPALLYPQFAASPLAKNNARSADWDASPESRKNNGFYQISGRVDYNLTEQIAVTSLSTYSHMDVDNYQDIDGSAVNSLAFDTYGKLKDFSQEVRAQLTVKKFVGMFGLNYQHSNTMDNAQLYLDQVSVNRPFGPGSMAFNRALASTDQKVDNYGIFANAEYKLTSRLGVQAGGRYSWSNRSAVSCSHDDTVGSPLVTFFDFLSNLLNPNITHPSAATCYQLNTLNGTDSPGPFPQHLNEHNLSYRGAINYKFDGGTMVFGSVSRGYKGAIISNIASSTDQQLLPVKQERLDDYEIGIKTPLFGRKVFLNVSGFYYDYRDKQLRARILDPVFGLIETLVTVPKSRIFGVDADLQMKPFRGMTITAAGTYLNSKIVGDFTTSNGAAVFDQAGQSGNFKGSPLSYTPKFTGSMDFEYRWALNDGFKAVVGSSLTYHSVDNAALELKGQSRPKLFATPSYALLDLRAGVSTADDRWRLEIFGRNVTNKYYWTTVYAGLDERHRYAGMPATYGLTVGFRY